MTTISLVSRAGVFARRGDPAPLIRRHLECTAFVLLWMAAGFYFHLSPIAYQILGLPLIAGFQLAMARRPLRQLWAFDAEEFRADWQTFVLAVGLFALCVALLGRGRLATGEEAPWVVVLLVAAVLPAAFALRQQRREKFRSALPIIAVALVVRLAWRVAWAPTWGGPVTFAFAQLPDFLADGLYEFSALFLVDEVAFRGALDPHLAAAGSSRLHAWTSAIFVSLLWSAWHFQAYHPHAKTFDQLFTQVGPQDFMPVIYGPVLSFCARRSRTLAPTAAIHAAGNAYVLTLLK